MKRASVFLFLICVGLHTIPLQANIEGMTDIMKSELAKRNSGLIARGRSRGKTAETHIVRFAVAADGSVMHFATWADCMIGTVVGNAHNIGTQVILLADGTFYDTSSNYSKKKDHFINKYSWGTVTSWDYKQVIQRK